MSTKKDLRFDPRELDAMQDPITVRVEKVRGSMRTPIDLPPREPDLAPGVGWDKDSIRRLETWLVNEWSGGGFYNFTITDSGGRRMEWQSVYPPAEFPERVPPTMQNATTAAAAAKAPAPAPLMGNNGGGMWPPPGFSYAPQTYAPQPPAYQTYPGGYQGGQPQPQAPMQIFLPSMQQAPNQSSGWGGNWAPPPPTAPAGSPFAAAAAPAAAPPAAAPPSPFLTSMRGNLGEDFGRRRPRFLDDDDGEKKELERRTKEMEERLRLAERAQLEAHHQRELEKAQQLAHRELEKAQQQAHQQLEQMRLAATQAQAQANQANPEMEQLREARQQIERERERNERDQRERSERERVDRQFAEMISMIKGIAEQRTQPTGPDPTVAALQEQQKTLQDELRRERERAQREQADRDREERIRREQEAREEKLRHEQEVREERARREADAVKEEIRRRDDENRRREELLQQQLLEIKNSANRGPDPMIMMMQESTRQQMDAMKEIMRAQTANMLSPRDIIAIQKDSSTGLDELKRNVVDVYKDVFDMQRELMAQAAQLQTGGESPTMRILEEGIKRATGLADRYLNVKKVEAIGQAKVQEASVTARAMHEQAQMQASHAWNVQQAQLAELARREAAQTRAEVAQGLGGNGLNGAGAAPNGANSANGANGTSNHVLKKPKKTAATKPTEVFDNGNNDPTTGATAPIAKVIPLRRHGRTDEEWFGPALPHVKQLREAVVEYIRSLQQDPPRIDTKTGEVVGASAEQSVEFLMRAVNYVMARNQAEQVPAISELFLEDRFPELMDILIPDAPQAYRDDCVQIILNIAKQMQAENELPGEDDEDDENDDEDDDDDEDAE